MGNGKVVGGPIIGPSLPQPNGLTSLVDSTKAVVDFGFNRSDSSVLLIKEDGSGQVMFAPEENLKMKDLVKRRGLN